MGHDSFGGHLGYRKTRERIRLSFYWLMLASDTHRWVQTCVSCQKRARVTCKDRVPISAIPRAESVYALVYGLFGTTL
jgi:hypothetical protein